MSVNYNRLRDTRLRDTINGLEVLNDHPICHWDPSTKSIKEGTNDDATIFFIKDDYLDNLLIDINKEEDFLLAHFEKTGNYIKNQFKKEHVKEGHHGVKTHPDKSYTYYAIVLETLLYGIDEAGREIKAGQEAEVIINIIWSDLETGEDLSSMVHRRTETSKEKEILEFVEKLNDYYNNYPKNDKTTQL